MFCERRMTAPVRTGAASRSGSGESLVSFCFSWRQKQIITPSICLIRKSLCSIAGLNAVSREQHPQRRRGRPQGGEAHSLDWSVAPTQSARIAARLTRRDAGHANRRGVRARAASPHWRTSARRARRPRGSSAPAGARRGARAKTNKLLLVFMKVLIINALVNCCARRSCTVY